MVGRRRGNVMRGTGTVTHLHEAAGSVDMGTDLAGLIVIVAISIIVALIADHLVG